MELIDFVRERALEDALFARACDPPDRELMAVGRVAARLVGRCEGREPRLTPRQWSLLWQIAVRHRGHRDFDPRWVLLAWQR